MREREKAGEGRGVEERGVKEKKEKGREGREGGRETEAEGERDLDAIPFSLWFCGDQTSAKTS